MANVFTFDFFDRKAKRLKKKFNTLTGELAKLIKELETTPEMGTDLGGSFYKIRLASDSKGGGKSGGFRVVTYFVEQTMEGDVVYLVTIYDKSEQSNITKKELLKIIKNELD
jgi:hypothetical protein